MKKVLVKCEDCGSYFYATPGDGPKLCDICEAAREKKRRWVTSTQPSNC